MKRLVAFFAAVAVMMVSLPTMQAQAATTGTYPTRKGAILVTTDPWFTFIGIGFGFGHSAIVYSSSTVVESLQNGVVTGKNDWNTSRTRLKASTVKDTTAAQDSVAADWVYGKLGKPYNYNFFDTSTRSRFYCSQLIWAAYKDNYGINLNTVSYDISRSIVAVAPTELVNSDKVDITYTQE